jgi:DnaJ-class molecular chaperone
MDIRKYFETLDLDINASLDEAKQAYKDIANVWHPDRFSHNQRLKLKAEKKLKEVNIAYEEVKSFLSSKKMKYYQDKAGEENKYNGTTWAKNNAQTNNRSEYHDNNINAENKDRTEHTVEVGTGIVLSLWSYLSKTFRQAINTQVQNFKTETTKENPRNTNNRQWQNSRMGKGMGRMNGSGMGRGKGRRR